MKSATWPGIALLVAALLGTLLQARPAPPRPRRRPRSRRFQRSWGSRARRPRARPTRRSPSSSSRTSNARSAAAISSRRLARSRRNTSPPARSESGSSFPARANPSAGVQGRRSGRVRRGTGQVLGDARPVVREPAGVDARQPVDACPGPRPGCTEVCRVFRRSGVGTGSGRYGAGSEAGVTATPNFSGDDDPGRKNQSDTEAEWRRALHHIQGGYRRHACQCATGPIASCSLRRSRSRARGRWLAQRGGTPCGRDAGRQQGHLSSPCNHGPATRSTPAGWATGGQRNLSARHPQAEALGRALRTLRVPRARFSSAPCSAPAIPLNAHSAKADRSHLDLVADDYAGQSVGPMIEATRASPDGAPPGTIASCRPSHAARVGAWTQFPDTVLPEGAMAVFLPRGLGVEPRLLGTITAERLIHSATVRR